MVITRNEIEKYLFNGRVDFCIECRRDTKYVLQKKNIKKTMKEKKYMFSITSAICSECGEEMSLPGLIDKNVQEIDEQYRVREGLVSIEDIWSSLDRRFSWISLQRPVFVCWNRTEKVRREKVR